MTHDIVSRHCDVRLTGTSDDPQGGMTRMDCPECGDEMHVNVVDWPTSDWPYPEEPNND